MSTEEKLVLLYDAELRRPGCVLLQAVAGCGHNSGFMQMTFAPNSWLVAPTNGMKRYAATRDEWNRIAKLPQKKAAK